MLANLVFRAVDPALIRPSTVLREVLQPLDVATVQLAFPTRLLRVPAFVAHAIIVPRPTRTTYDAAVTLFLGILFSAIGGVYAFYGRKNYNASFLVCGVLLMIYPYVVPGAVLIFIVGVGLVTIPIALLKGWI